MPIALAILISLYLYKRRKFFNRDRGNGVDGPGGGRSHGCVWSRGLSCCRPSLSKERERVLSGRGGQGGGTGVFLQSGGEERQVREEIVLRAQLDLGQRREERSSFSLLKSLLNDNPTLQNHANPQNVTCFKL